MYSSNDKIQKNQNKSQISNSKFLNSHPGTNAAIAIAIDGIVPAQVGLPVEAVPVRERDKAGSWQVGSGLIGSTAVALPVVYHLVGLFKMEDGVGELVFGSHTLFVLVNRIVLEGFQVFLGLGVVSPFSMYFFMDVPLVSS